MLPPEDMLLSEDMLPSEDMLLSEDIPPSEDVLLSEDMPLLMLDDMLLEPLEAVALLEPSDEALCNCCGHTHMGAEVSVMGVPFGADTAGSLIELSGRGRAFATPERRVKPATKKVDT